MALLPKAAFAVAFHGASQASEPIASVGGLWAHGRQTITHAINAATGKHGIWAVENQAGGTDSSNITNRAQRGEGVQSEFFRGARNLLFPPDASREVRGRRSARLRPLAQAIHRAITQLSGMAAGQ